MMNFYPIEEKVTTANPHADELILNVDDSDGARYAKSRILMRAGFKVIEAASGEEALLKARSETPSLILLDVKLPDINGMEVCRQLKADPDTQTILVLQTSASFLGVADKVRALDGGADNYLLEPIEPEELVANVKALLRLGKVERQLRESDRRKDEFLATLAHELRNPLGPIRNAVHLLRKLDPQVPQMQENARNTIQRHTDHLAHLIDDLLDVSRISQGKISLRTNMVELKSFMNSAVESASVAVEKGKHQLTVHLPEEDVWIYGDKVRLSQVVSNLLTNAAKFTEQGGRISVDTFIKGGCVHIRVSDNGIGIDPRNIDTIFQLFVQSGHLQNRVQDGLGIGLSLVKTLVELHGGTVRVESPGIGQGSIFEVRLPVAEAPELNQPDEVPANALPVEPKRVLVVDDNVDAADTLAQLLSLMGHDVKTAYKGADAITHAAAFLPDIVFLDIGLPDITGYDVARQLRTLPEMNHALLVALTGYGQAHHRQEALNAGFNQHFAKPVDFEKLGQLGLYV